MKFYQYTDYKRYVYLVYEDEIPAFVLKHFTDISYGFKKTNVLCISLDKKTFTYCDQFNVQYVHFKENKNLFYEMLKEILKTKNRKER